MAGGGHGTKAILAALFANAGIAIAKFVAFVVTGSASMLAESVHSVADSSNQGLLLIGGKRARRDATEQHPFGFGRERYFYSFVVAIVLFTLGSAFALFEGYEKVRHPHELASIGWAVGVLVLGIVLEGFSFRTAIVEAQKVKRPETSWWSYVRNSRSPEIPVVLLEDLGALIGLILALSGVGMFVVTDDPVWDGIGTLSIGVLLGVIAVILAFEMKSLLMGESATSSMLTEIRSTLETHPDVQSVIHMQTQHIGPDELLVGAKLEFSSDLSVAELSEAVNEVERSLREAIPIARVIYLEPDVPAAVSQA